MMSTNVNESDRLILVVDAELSSYRGILRLGKALQSEVNHVTTRSELLNWLHENQAKLENPITAFCLIFDPEIVEITLEGSMNQLLLGYPRICISRSSDVATTVRSIKTGLYDFIEKPFSLVRMSNTLEQAFSLHEFAVTIKNQFHSLTKREIETCELVVQGRSNKEISEKLEISIKTVKVHRANLMRKTQAKSVTDLLRLHDRFSSVTQPETHAFYGLSTLKVLGQKVAHL